MPIQVYSFYIFDRHTECVYSKLWLAPAPPRPQSLTSTAMSTSRPGSTMTTTGAAASDQTITSPPAATIAPASQSQHRHHQSLAIEPSSSQQPHSSGSGSGSDARTATATQQRPRRAEKDRAADDAKLIFGTVFSLRNMARKLGGEDDAFISYRTAQYKLHYYETPTNLRFALLTEPAALSMRNVLHQIYINLWVEYVVKNPLSPAEHKGGEGVRNEMFEMGLDKFIRGLM